MDDFPEGASYRSADSTLFERRELVPPARKGSTSSIPHDTSRCSTWAGLFRYPPVRFLLC